MSKRACKSDDRHPSAAFVDGAGCGHDWPCQRPIDTRLITKVTTGRDPAFEIIGSSPNVGDANSLGLGLPADPTTSLDSRYMCRLATLDVMEGQQAELVSWKQLLTIGAYLTSVGGPPDYKIERLVNDPIWHFSDAGVSWHLYFEEITKRRGRLAAIIVPGWTPDPNGADPSILYAALPVSLGGAGYRPLFGGKPPGRAIEPFGTVYDIRSPWGRACECPRGLVITGAGRISCWASVRQTDPSTRPSVQLAGSGYCPEEAFVQANPLARYLRAGVEMTWKVSSRAKRNVEP